MQLDYKMIGQRIAQRRRNLHLKQTEVEEMAELGCKYLSNIERGISIPSTEVIMRLAVALDTTPDEFLVGTAIADPQGRWRTVAQKLKALTPKQLALAEELIDIAAKQDI